MYVSTNLSVHGITILVLLLLLLLLLLLFFRGFFSLSPTAGGGVKERDTERGERERNMVKNFKKKSEVVVNRNQALEKQVNPLFLYVCLP
ncbi:hypothetical protein F5X96DRAFT_622795 [Biscogniauxia mediterranea]|nr:hypothetical protein F5X96DRAFT_622795 [Biscogniauxia mediterranea]